MKCWICGNIANSKEHKLKKSLLKSYFKKDFENKSVIHIKDNREFKLNGPNSDRIKFEKVICEECNNDKSQNYDLSFDIFVEYLKANKDLIYSSKVIDFKNIYGVDFPKSQTDLFKYFVKILGCDLSENGFVVPYDLVELLKKEHFQTRLKITLSLNEELLKTNLLSLLKFGELITTQTNLETKSEINTKYRFELDISYIRINFFYNCFSDIGVGSDWIADKQYLYLGVSKNFDTNYI